jgi:hypothetical protein
LKVKNLDFNIDVLVIESDNTQKNKK